MSSCIFCRILAGEAEATLVHEDADVVAFLDLHPWRPGHTLVVPRIHAQHLRELDPRLRAHLWAVGNALSEPLRSAVGAQAVHLLVNDGRAAFQSVPHVHLHLVPRARGDGLRLLANVLLWPVQRLFPAKRPALEAVGAAIRVAVQEDNP